MAEIRPIEREDLPAVAAMLHADLTASTPEAEIERSITGTMLDSPWRDDELPSLVATEDGEVTGFIGSQPRRFRFRERTLRGVCISHLTVASGRRGGAAGALLLRRMLNSGQDFTYSDTANDEVARIWQVLGGELDSTRACDWIAVLRRGRWLRGAARRGLRRGGGLPVGALPLSALLRSGVETKPAAELGAVSENAEPASIAERLSEMDRGFALRADYDEGFLAHVFAEIEAQFGTLVRRLVRRGGRPAGWYAYVPNLRGTGRVVHLMLSERDGDAVVADLFEHARAQGCSVLAGRLEPHLTATLEPLRPGLAFARRPMLHSHDAELRGALASSSSLLTQLDGEWFVL